MKALFVALGIYGREGGMERFNRRLVKALSELRAAGGLRSASAIALWDTPDHAAHMPEGIRFVPGSSQKLATALVFLMTVVRERPDMVLYGHVLLIPLVVIGRLLRPRARHILIVHGVEAWSAPSPARRFIVRNLVDRIISVSRFTATRMGAAYGLPEGRFWLLPNALDLPAGAEAADPEPSRSLRGRWRLVAVSRLARSDVYKNVDKVILALPRILEAFPDTHYYIVGDGSWRADLEHLVHRTRLSDHVHFLGRLDDRRRDEVYSQAHLFVLPSVKEGFGIVFLEAWRYRLPIVAGNEDASTEVIRHGVDGLCVSPRPDAVAEAVCSLLRDADLRRKMGAAGHERLRNQFTHGHFREALRQVFVSRACAG